MKIKALTPSFLILALVLSGCALPGSTTGKGKAAVRKAPSLPPMPPGWKAKRAKAQPKAHAGLVPAAVGDPYYVPGSPPMELLDWFDPDTRLVRVLQQSNTVVRIKQTETLGGELQEIAVFECSQQPEAQWVATTVGRNHPQLFVAGSNEMCPPVSLASQAAPERVVGTGRKVKTKDGKEWFVLKLPKTGTAERYLLRPVPPAR